MSNVFDGLPGKDMIMNGHDQILGNRGREGMGVINLISELERASLVRLELLDIHGEKSLTVELRGAGIEKVIHELKRCNLVIEYEQ